jgi:uncharacterized protein YjbI with pentapeptide repeats
MTNHKDILESGVAEWNAWRQANPEVRPRLLYENLIGRDLDGVDFLGAELTGTLLANCSLRRADISFAHLWRANFDHSDLTEAVLTRSELTDATLLGADLSRALLPCATLRQADLRESQLVGADLHETDLRKALLADANLDGASLDGANLNGATLQGAVLTGCRLDGATLVETDLTGADLSGSSVYGTAVWKANLDGTTQTDLTITSRGEPLITVDRLELAQFIYLLWSNDDLRHVVDTITSRVVLILGRFSRDRKPVLDALRDELRHRNLAPVLFDFDVPERKDLTGTVELFARMSRFVIADLTDPSSLPHELATIIPHLRTTPVLPIRPQGATTYGMFKDLLAYPWVLEPIEYADARQLVGSLPDLVQRALQWCPSDRSPASSMARNNTDPRVDSYIEGLPEWQQAICREVRNLAHGADPELRETIKRTRQPYFVLQGNVCALRAAKSWVNIFLYDGGIVPDPQGIITGGHDNKTARTVAIRQGEKINARALTAMFKRIIANNRAGGWRKLTARKASGK